MLICRHCGQENPEIARFCLACATPLSRGEGVERRKLATFLFCDMAGSTAMGERLDPESVRDMMFRYFQEMRGVIEHHGGTVDKFIGDAVVAIFGVPVVREDDALRALRAASGMHERLEVLNDELERRFGHRIAIRIGVNTGEVVAGERTAEQTLVLGDAVNLAARLEQAAAPGEVLIGETTFRLARNTVTVDPVEPLELKGKAERVPAYRLVAVSPPRVHSRLAASTVGREAELRELTGRFAQAVTECACRLVTILGNPGVGKTHLGVQFVAAVGDDAHVLRSHCLSYGEGITFWPLAEMVREAARIEEDDSREIARARLLKLVSTEGESAPVIAERVGQAIGLFGGSAPAAEIDWAFRRLFERLASDRPLVLVIEDVHWAEPALLDLLESLVERSHSVPIFILCLARPELLERRPEWEATMSLRPLDSADATRLVEQLLGPGIREGLRDRLVAAAEGNPLFLEELVRMLVDDGLLESVDGGWVARAVIGEFDIPPTINALLNARLDRLEASERDALERGAVEGGTFHRDAVAALGEGPDAELALLLASLVRKEFVAVAKPTLSGEEAYDFFHVLIRDSTYRTTPKKRRAELHERFAGWLEAAAGERLLEYEELLGYHLEQAYRLRSELGPVAGPEQETAARAIHHLSRSARRAHARGDVRAAANLLGRSLSLVSEDALRAELLVELARAQTASGELAAAERTLSDALALTGHASASTTANADMQLASLRFHRDAESTTDLLFDAADRATEVFRRVGDERGLARAARTMGYAHLVEGRYGLCARTLQQALAHASLAGDEGEKRGVLNMIGFALWFGPVPVPEAVRYLEDAREDATGQPIAEAAVLPPLAGLYAMAGDFDHARTLIRRGRRMLDELGLRGQLADIALVSSAVELLADDLNGAEAALKEGYDILEAMGEKAMLSTLAASLANVHWAQGRPGDAERFLEIGERAASPDDVVSQTRLKSARARLLAHRRVHDEAETVARDAAGALDESDALDERANTLGALAEVLFLSGKDDDARSVSTDALRLYEAKGNRVAAARTAATLGRSTPIANA